MHFSYKAKCYVPTENVLGCVTYNRAESRPVLALCAPDHRHRPPATASDMPRRGCSAKRATAARTAAPGRSEDIPLLHTSSPPYVQYRQHGDDDDDAQSWSERITLRTAITHPISQRAPAYAQRSSEDSSCWEHTPARSSKSTGFVLTRTHA